MKFGWILILIALPCFAFGADIRNEGMFVSASSYSVTGFYEVVDVVVPDIGGRVVVPERGIEVSLNDLIDYLKGGAAALVRNRFTFYNNSAWDKYGISADKNDDLAIAIDKEAARPGRDTSFVNYTSYNKGLNGIMIDFSNLALPEKISVNDFDFRIGNAAEFDSPAPAPREIAVRQLRNGYHRVTVIFPNRSIQNQWLKTTVIANANTGLKRDDVFYYGNAVGSAGKSRSSAEVGVNDVASAIAQLKGIRAVGITSPYDYDRNGKMNMADAVIAFNAITRGESYGDDNDEVMKSIALSLGLPERELRFEQRDALVLFRTDRNEVDMGSVKIDMLWFSNGYLYLELNEDLLELVYSSSLEPNSWIRLVDLPSLKRCGIGWVIESVDLPETVFFRAQYPE